MLVVGLGKRVPTGPVGHKEQVARARRVGRRFERGAARIGDRSGRQAFDHIGVVRRRLRDLGALDRPAQRSLAADQAVDDGRIGLQLDPLPQAIGEDGGHAAALVGPAGFLLDDRGQRDELLRRLDQNIGIAALPDLREHPLLGLLHALDHLFARGAAREFVGFRQQRAFARHFPHAPSEDVVVDEPRHDLFGRQALRDSDGVLHHLALDDGGDDIAQAGILLKGIFARLEVGTCLERKHAADECPGIDVDHALAQQHVGDVALAGTRGNVDDLVFPQRARGLQHLPAVIVHRSRPDHQNDQDGDDGIADDHERIAGALRPLRRRRHLLGLQRSARAPW